MPHDGERTSVEGTERCVLCCGHVSLNPGAAPLKSQIFLFTEVRICLCRLRDPFTCDSYGGTKISHLSLPKCQIVFVTYMQWAGGKVR